MRIGIVGAGAAGLVAAYDLSNAGHKVVVYESAPFIGGQASTIPVGGHPLERGYHHLFTNDRAILDLMVELGIGDAMEWYPSSVGTYVDGGLHRTTTAFDLLRFNAIPIWERIKMGLFTLRVQRIKNWESLEPYTADQWLSEKLGGQAYDVLWNPLLRGKFGTVLRRSWDAMVLVENPDEVRVARWIAGEGGTRVSNRQLRYGFRHAGCENQSRWRRDPHREVQSPRSSRRMNPDL